jgi:hypothetical protein
VAACIRAQMEAFFIQERDVMRLRYMHWKEEDFHLGYLEDYPDYVTQGETGEELLENLKDLYRDISSGQVPYIRKVDELVFAT